MGFNGLEMRHKSFVFRIFRCLERLEMVRFLIESF